MRFDGSTIRVHVAGIGRVPALRRARTLRPQRARRAVTLIELLIVMMILLMVTAAAIPIVMPAMQNRQMREGSRLVSSYLQSARSRAIEIGRPVGVKLERFNGAPFALVISQVEVPPPYSGDTLDSQCTVVTPPSTMTSMSAQANYTARYGTLPVVWLTAAMPIDFNSTLVRVGDTIQFGGKGPQFVILGPDEMPAPDGIIDANVPLDVAYVSTVGLAPNFPWASATQGTSYQIIRQPVRSLTEPLQLPEGIVVDLYCSGVGNRGVFFDEATSFGGAGVMTGSAPTAGAYVNFDPVILFSPAGRLESVSSVAPPAGQLVYPTDAVYLLLGRRELMFDVAKRNTASDIVAQNLSPVPPSTAVAGVENEATWPVPPQHFWVSVGYQTGLVTVSEVAKNMQDYQPMMPKDLQDVIIDALFDARKFAREAQSVGGR